MIKVIAGIVTYNPNLTKLRENLSAIVSQVAETVIIDNASENLDAIKKLVDEFPNVDIEVNSENKGIASALNQIFAKAYRSASTYVLTLDQDSKVYPDLVNTYLENESLGDSFTCLRKDRNFQSEAQENENIECVESCITSGNLVKLNAWKAVGGFNEHLFIDMVDVDFCYRLRAAGYRIVRINKYGMLHEIGDGSYVSLFGRKHFTGNYSAFRKYYIFRNMSYVIRKYHLCKHYYSYKRLLLLFVSIWLSEDDKIQKSIKAIEGFIDSFKMYDYLSSGGGRRRINIFNKSWHLNELPIAYRMGGAFI